jgi:hypothetical protein
MFDLLTATEVRRTVVASIGPFVWTTIPVDEASRSSLARQWIVRQDRQRRRRTPLPTVERGRTSKKDGLNEDMKNEDMKLKLERR